MADVLRTALKGAWARKRRLLGTAAAVVLGVAFLTATLVLGDSARAGFETSFTEANAGTDAVVRSATSVDGADGPITAPIDAAIVDTVAAVDGVATVAPSVAGFAQIVGADGDPLGGQGPPTLGANWVEDPALNGYDLAEGRVPEGPGEVVIDRASAEAGGLAVGDRTTVLAPTPEPVTVVGIATFGDRDSLGGVTLAAFTLDEAQRLLLGDQPKVTAVVVAGEEGVAQDELAGRIEAVLPGGVEAITGAELTAEQQATIESAFLGFFQTALTMFAAVALLVAAFSVVNTFAILVAQRTRESALLRAIGASRRQVLTAGLVEAAVVGLVGTVAGIAAGVAVAAGLQALMDAAGFGLPVDGLRLDANSVLVAGTVGMLVTMVGGVVPAVRASRVAPLAALRDVEVDDSGASRWRAVLGVVLGAAGVALVLSGTAAEGSVARAGLGALAVVTAVVVSGPVVARPVGSLLGAPLRFRGVAGDLARRNAVRNPRRTAASAAALLVGVGVVTLFTVFGASVSASIGEAVDRSFGGDLVIESTGWSSAGLGPDLLADVRGLPEVGAAAGLGFGAATMDGEDRQVGFADLPALADIADFDVVEGDMAAVGAGELAISADRAESDGWAVGDRVEVGFPDGTTEALTVAAVYDDRALGGDVLVPDEVWVPRAPQPAYALVLVGLADGVALADARDAVVGVTSRYGGPDVSDRDEFVASQAAEVDALLTVIYGLLAVAILIALMGIANTLSLSVHERTRELGLLRAVGQTRSQLRAMVRWESVVVATFGTVGGVAVGVFLGWGLVRTLAATEGLGTFVLPVGSLVTVVAAGAAVGVLAGLRPAWRAARLDVLAAVAAE